MEHHAHHFTPSFYPLFIVLFCGSVLMMFTLPDPNKLRGNNLVLRDKDVMLFRKPLPLRRFTLMLSGFLFLLVISIVPIAAEGRNPLPGYFMCLMLLAFPVIFLYASGPNDIRLDGSRRTYERTVGFSWKPVTKSGTFDGIEGISVSLQDGVQLIMEKPSGLSRSVTLSSSGTNAASEALVEELKWEYGFAMVPYPKK